MNTMNVFRLIVAAMVVIALIVIVDQIFQELFRESELDKEISELVLNARKVEGRVFDTEVFLKSNQIVTAQSVEEDLTNVVFACAGSVCCEKGEPCENIVEWDEKKIEIKAKNNVYLYARCFIDKIFFCTVYAGTKPSTVKIEARATGKNLIEDEKIKLEIKTSNEGDVFAREIGRKIIVLYDEHEIDKISLENIQLNGNDVLTEEKEIKLSSGNYKLVFEAVNLFDQSDRSKSELELKVMPSEKVCVADKGTVEESYDLELGNIEKYYCANCLFAFECADAWKKLSYNVIEKNAEYAIKIINN